MKRTSLCPMAVACSGNRHQGAYVLVPGYSSDEALDANSATHHDKHDLKLPFCLTFSKDATRSESDPGNADAVARDCDIFPPFCCPEGDAVATLWGAGGGTLRGACS